jgi:hypothetical protein
MSDPFYDENKDPFEKEPFIQKLKRNRFFVIALLLHLVAFFIFGSKVLWKLEPKKSLESTSLFAPPSNKPEQKPIQEPEKKVEVKVQPQNTPSKSVITTDKLSANYNVPLPGVIAGPTAGATPSGPGGNGSGNGPNDSGLNKIEIPQPRVEIVFCVDISRSMISAGRPFKVVEQELGRQVRRLKENNAFNIITFAKVGRAYKNELVPGTVAEIETALIWFHKLSPDSFKAENWKKDQIDNILDFHLGSHPQAALEQAFKHTPAKVVLLSDGNPTDISRDEVMEQIDALEAKLKTKVPVHTILFQTAGTQNQNDDARTFMQMVAANTGGEFLEVSNPRKSGPGTNP